LKPSFGAAGFLLGQPMPSFVGDAGKDGGQSGIFAGITPTGELLVKPLSSLVDQGKSFVTNTATATLPDFIDLVLTAVPLGDHYTMLLQSFDVDSHTETARLSYWNVPASLVHGHPGLGVFPQLKGDRTAVAFDDWRVDGMDALVSADDESGVGPIVGAWHTVNRNTLRLTVQLMPVGKRRNSVKFQIFDGTKWQTKDVSDIDPVTFMASFSVDGLDLSRDLPYRLEYGESLSSGDICFHYWSGTIAAANDGSNVLVIAGNESATIAGLPPADVLVFTNVSAPLAAAQTPGSLEEWYSWCFKHREQGRNVPCLGIFNSAMTYRRVHIEVADTADISADSPADDWNDWVGADMKVVWAPDLFRMVHKYIDSMADGKVEDVSSDKAGQDGCIGYVSVDAAQRGVTYNCVTVGKDGSIKNSSGWPIHCMHSFWYDRNHIGYLAPVEVMGRKNAVVQVLDDNSGKLVYSVRSKGTVLLTRIFRVGHYTVVAGDPETGTQRRFSSQTQRSPDNVNALRVEF
jgi:hypothetical protein